MSCLTCEEKVLDSTDCAKRVYGFIWAESFSWCKRADVGLLDVNEFNLDDAFVVTNNTKFQDIEDLLGREYAEDCMSNMFG